MRSTAGIVGRDDMTTSSREGCQSLNLCARRRSVATPSFPNHLNLPLEALNSPPNVIRKPLGDLRLKITRTHPAPLITSISDRTSPLVVTITLAQVATPLTGDTR
jgi:hypothetical protein